MDCLNKKMESWKQHSHNNEAEDAENGIDESRHKDEYEDVATNLCTSHAIEIL